MGESPALPRTPVTKSPRARLPATAEARYRLLVESVTDYAIYMLDLGGHITSWNAGAQRFKGYAEHEILGQHFSRFYGEDDRAAGLPERALATAVSEGKFEGEGWRVRKDGTRFWAHVVIDPIRDGSGELLGYAKITRDLSERRDAEQALRRSQEQFRLLVHSVTDYAIYMIDVEGHVISWNAGAQRIKQYTPAEILGEHFSRFYRPQDREAGEPQRALRQAAAEGRYESEGWRVRKDGSEFWANVVVDSIRDDSGAIVGFAKVTRDVTAKRQAQHELEVAREALFQSQKLDAIGQLSGGVAHDFNNLLMVILSSLRMIERRAGAEPSLQRLVDNAIKATQRGASLTQRMLSFARRQALNPQPVDLRALVDGVSDLLRRSIGPSIHIHITVPQGLPPVLVDANQFELALLNLVVNSRDAMPAGGTITITACACTQTPSELDLLEGSYLRLDVVDEGQGMEQEVLARATEPFFTTKGVGKGTGLGLSMVEGLASQLGGRFVLTSAPGRGTTASLWLPVASGSAPAHGEEAGAGASPTATTLRVLAVDDDLLVLNNVIAMLEDSGHQVIAAGSAAEALNVLRDDLNIDVLFTDHAMPQMTGAELLLAARNRIPGLACVLASGYAELNASLPANTVRLNKPFDQEELARALVLARQQAAQ
jgi:PAS domain S-box-containing protein